MEKNFTFTEVQCSVKENNVSIDIAAAPINIFPSNFKLHKESIMYVPAYPSKCGSGDVASNFRYKHDIDINNIVCQKWEELLKNYKVINSNPVVITALPREGRLLSFKMKEDGNISVIHKENKKEDNPLSNYLKSFLESFNINQGVILKMRKSSEGAGYYSYLSDVISFLNMVNYNFNPEMFESKNLQFEIVKPNDINDQGLKKLTKVVKGGKEWTPIEGFNYLYFKENDNLSNEDTMEYMLPKPEVYKKIYSQFYDLISLEENNTKANIRNYFSNINLFIRWSDYWVNDIDDALTILAVINSYNFVSLTKEESKIKDQFIEISKTIFS